MNALDYYKNPQILSAISYQVNRIKGAYDKEECQQEIYAELYDFMPLDIEDAQRIINRVGCKYRRHIKKDYVNTAPYRDWADWSDLGSGSYQRKCHIGSAD